MESKVSFETAYFLINSSDVRPFIIEVKEKFNNIYKESLSRKEIEFITSGLELFLEEKGFTLKAGKEIRLVEIQDNYARLEACFNYLKLILSYKKVPCPEYVLDLIFKELEGSISYYFIPMIRNPSIQNKINITKEEMNKKLNEIHDMRLALWRKEESDFVEKINLIFLKKIIKDPFLSVSLRKLFRLYGSNEYKMEASFTPIKDIPIECPKSKFRPQDRNSKIILLYFYMTINFPGQINEDECARKFPTSKFNNEIFAIANQEIGAAKEIEMRAQKIEKKKRKTKVTKKKWTPLISGIKNKEQVDGIINNFATRFYQNR